MVNTDMTQVEMLSLSRACLDLFRGKSVPVWTGHVSTG
jgi:hypothetical protein